ncbi:MAG: M48 family metalloprotease [archaeon]|nr:M48 family metalloprotease [archaeon]
MTGWRFRTAIMFVFLTALLMFMGALASLWLSSGWYIGAGVMLMFSSIMCLISYYKSKEIALRMNHAKIIDERENPRLYRLVREVAQRAEVPMPEVGLCISPQPNAFATGRNPSHAAVVVTSSLLDLLPDDELRGVIAHEMSHIKNRDILIMSIASTLAMAISYVAHYLYWIAFVNSFDKQRDDDNSAIILMAVAIATQILVPIAAVIVQLGISRNREYLADETGAKITGSPLALARALRHLDETIGKINSPINYHTRTHNSGTTTAFNPADEYQSAHMWIANPLTGKRSIFSSLFSTHPPMEERIARLNALAYKLGLYS